ncbi:Protein disulfide-isomerase [Diplonema papillatum]|nr:Protein disulfide-isomerase [Diplonema papillatum]
MKCSKAAFKRTASCSLVEEYGNMVSPNRMPSSFSNTKQGLMTLAAENRVETSGNERGTHIVWSLSALFLLSSSTASCSAFRAWGVNVSSSLNNKSLSPLLPIPILPANLSRYTPSRPRKVRISFTGTRVFLSKKLRKAETLDNASRSAKCTGLMSSTKLTTATQDVDSCRVCSRCDPVASRNEDLNEARSVKEKKSITPVAEEAVVFSTSTIVLPSDSEM